MSGASFFRGKIDQTAFLVGFALLLLAFLVRLVGIGWGLPNEVRQDSLHPDEHVVWVYSQQIKPTQGQFTPGFYNYGTLYLTLTRIVSDVATVYGGGGEVKTQEDQKKRIGRLIGAGRVVSALAGSATAWVVFLILYRRTAVFGAVLAGLAVAFAPGHVVHSRFQTVDVVAAFLLALSLYWATRLVPRDDCDEITPELAIRFCLLSGLFAGLSMGTKYSGFLALLALGVIALFALKSELLKKVRIKGVLAGFGVCFLAFVITTPGVLLDQAKFMKDFVYEMQHVSEGHGLVFAGTGSGFSYHILNLVFGLGAGLLVLAAAGLGRAAYRRHVWAFGLLAFLLAYYLLIARAEVRFFRYVIPMIPVLAVGFGWLAGQAHQYPERKFRWLGIASIVALFGLVLPGGGIAGTATMTSWMSLPDRRDYAGLVLKNDLAKEGDTVGLVKDPWFWSVTVFPQVAAWRAELPQIFQAMDQTSAPRVVRYLPDNFGERKDWDIRLLTELAPTFVAYTSFETEGYSRVAAMASPPAAFAAQATAFREFQELLQSDYELVYHDDLEGIEIHDLQYIRPKVWIWKRKSALTETQSSSSTPSGSSGAAAPTQ
ncbi:MAG: glycosyltransferase family 39 protein [Fimbriimonadaceae bacterium]|jgi:hypothetical protein|nr:glycosyltransferase family 39 protein [Fimbriimonadaceae bacterium]